MKYLRCLENIIDYFAEICKSKDNNNYIYKLKIV